MKTEESYITGSKTLWEKEKLLITSDFSFSHSVFKRLVLENIVRKEENAASSIFSFSHSVFKRLVLQTRKNQGLFGKGLMDNNA